MKIGKINYLYLLVLLTFITCSYDDGHQLPYENKISDNQVLLEKIKETPWKVTKVNEAITWKSYHFSDIFNSPQYINVIDIDLSKNPKIEIVDSDYKVFKTVSEFAEDNNAEIAINGSYFGLETGKSTTFFKKDNKIKNQTLDRFPSFRENGSFALDKDNKPVIVSKPSNGWESLIYPDALAGGPTLIMEGNKVKQLDNPFNTARHPRTAIGVTKNNHLLFVVIDGRSSQSHGVTIDQLSDFLLSLDCISAINFDGGGSSTAWVKNEGVVNHPSDNKVFDNKGQRPVATAIIVK